MNAKGCRLLIGHALLFISGWLIYAANACTNAAARVGQVGDYAE